MLEDHLKSPITRQRLLAGPFSPFLDLYADGLHAQGYSPISITSSLRSLACWTDWMREHGFTTDTSAVARVCPLTLAIDDLQWRPRRGSCSSFWPRRTRREGAQPRQGRCASDPR